MPDDPFEGKLRPAAERIDAGALGVPGSRRFRVMVVLAGETHIVWMEKEQLRQLGDAILQVLIGLPPADSELRLVGAPPFASDSLNQFRAGQIELGFEEPTGRIVLVIHDIEAEAGDEPALTCSLSRDQAHDLAANAEAVVSAGRPICPLCGQPITGEHHACVKQNGHLPHHLDDVEGDADDAP